MTDGADEELVRAATAARLRAHAPYSSYLVGAAVRTASGEVIVGCNVENASYPAGLCAEHAAVAHAVVGGHRSISAVAVVVDGPSPVAPCGVCRQVLSEFGLDARVILGTVSGEREETTVRALLPHSFSAADLPDQP